MLCLSTPHADCILPVRATEAPTSTLPQHAPRRMHLDVAPVSANASALPQHVLRGLHRFVRLEHVVQFALPQHVLRGLHRGDRAVVSAIGIFASARPTRIASLRQTARVIFNSPLPQHVLRGLHRAEYYYFELPAYLCLSTSYADCITVRRSAPEEAMPLPQHVLRGLHRI